MNHPEIAATGNALPVTEDATQGMYVTMTIAHQLFGIPVLKVRDVLGPQRIAHVPLAPPEVLGSLNLRGRIVTAVDARTRLGLPPRDDKEKSMSVVVEHENELYSIVIDKVGEVMSLPTGDYERNPATLDPRWQEISSGIYRLKESLLIVIDVARFFSLDPQARAA